VEVVVTEGRHAAQIGTGMNAAQLTPQRHLAKVFGLLPGLPLLYGPNQVIAVVPCKVLAGVDDLDASLLQQMPVVTSLVIVTPAERLYVIAENEGEVASAVAGFGDQMLKGRAVVSAGAGDRVVGVEAHDRVAGLQGVPLDGRLLVPEGLLLAVGAAAQIAHG